MKAAARPLGRPTNTQTQSRKENTIMRVAFIIPHAKLWQFLPQNKFLTTVAGFNITRNTYELSFALVFWRNLPRFAGSLPDNKEKNNTFSDGSVSTSAAT